MYKLLLDFPQLNLPEDYLLARIRGKRNGRVRDWTEAARGGPAATSLSRGETRRSRDNIRWLWRRMPRRLRRAMAPVVLFLELKTLQAALRLLRAGQHDKIAPLLADSLLSSRLCNIFTRAASVGEALTWLEREADGELPALAGIAALAERSPPATVEALIMRAFLLRLGAMTLHPAVARFFRERIDIANVVNAVRSRAMRPEARLEFFPGGNRSPAVLARGRLAVALSAPSAAEREHMLLGVLCRRLRQESRDGDGVALCLDFLWSETMETRNLALLYHGRAMEPTELARELIW